MVKNKKTRKNNGSVTINVATPPALLVLIQQQAKDEGRKVSQMMRRIFELYYQQKGLYND
jgi:hypothetical protein